MNDTEPTPKPTRDRLWLPILLPLGILAGMALLMIPFSRILLNTSASAATIVALTVSVAILAAAALVASRGKIGTGALGSLLGVVAGVAMISGAIALVAAEPAEHGAEEEGGKEAFVASIAAPPNASVDGFSETELTVASDVPIELEFDNEEQGVQHNVQIFDSPDDASGTVLFDGELIAGPASTTYAIPPLREGSYHFNCIVHPSTMTGTLTVEKDVEPGGDLEQVIVAKDIAFDTDELRFEPDTPSNLTLDNQDAGIQHNVSIYGDAESLSPVLFQGELLAGVAEQTYEIPALEAGEYHFQCDVHPDMAGQVIVAPGGGGGGGGDGGGGGEPPAGEEVAPAADDAPPGEPQDQETG